MSPGRFRIFTTYPLGLFYAWSNVELDLHCLVYPRPEPGNVPLPPAQAASGEGGAQRHGRGRFRRTAHLPPRRFAAPRRLEGVRAQRHVPDQAVFGQRGRTAVARLGDIPDALGLEAKLSRLTRWVIEAEAQGVRFGLRLPDLELEPAAGTAHRDRCLEALALFQPVRR